MSGSPLNVSDLTALQIREHLLSGQETVEEFTVKLGQFVDAADANIHGDVFGGWIMAQVDIAGGVPAMCDGVTQGQPGMELSLFSRDVIAMAASTSIANTTRS